MRFRRWIVASAAALGIAAAAPVVAPAAQPSTNSAVVTKSCSGGFTHARINGSEKCLRRGEFCAASAKRQYVKYGYRCIGGRLR